ncbi:hypothetical protein CDAR_390261 [Caerostris darwini]|uniref:Uncharacterized protein n=1 Tax=Caerostris darwini TaxID=1538125 RepID=A0AAV4NXV5_9ARAC|nr:hypothetical protein CDAR_390261 [Caerostris darwini]
MPSQNTACLLSRATVLLSKQAEAFFFAEISCAASCQSGENMSVSEVQDYGEAGCPCFPISMPEVKGTKIFQCRDGQTTVRQNVHLARG